MNRRNFLTAAGAGALASPSLLALAQAPQVLTKRDTKPLVIASANGNVSQDAAGLTCVAKAFQMITGGADVLDAVVAGVNIVELDPEDTSVGYGGLPNADGVVQLDASVMHGTLKKAGAVACLEGVRTPSLVAKKVMEETDHLLLVGKDARSFARLMGFKIEADLNTEKSRKLWLEWKHRTDPEHYPDAKKRADALRRAGMDMIAEGLVDPEHFYGTINCNGLNSRGELAGVTTTSGLAWKNPWTGGRLTHYWSRIVRGRRSRSRRVHWAGRSESVVAGVISRCRVLAQRNVTEGRRHGGVKADSGEYRGKASSEQPWQPELQRQLLRFEP